VAANFFRLIRQVSVTLTTENCNDGATTLSRMAFLWIRRTCDYTVQGAPPQKKSKSLPDDQKIVLYTIKACQ